MPPVWNLKNNSAREFAARGAPPERLCGNPRRYESNTSGAGLRFSGEINARMLNSHVVTLAFTACRAFS